MAISRTSGSRMPHPPHSFCTCHGASPGTPPHARSCPVGVPSRLSRSCSDSWNDGLASAPPLTAGCRTSVEGPPGMLDYSLCGPALGFLPGLEVLERLFLDLGPFAPSGTCCRLFRLPRHLESP